jgi:hypothetical protein
VICRPTIMSCTSIYICETWFLMMAGEMMNHRFGSTTEKGTDIERAYHLLCGPLRADWLRGKDIGWRPHKNRTDQLYRLRPGSFFLLATLAKGLRRCRWYNHTAVITDDTTMFFPPFYFLQVLFSFFLSQSLFGEHLFLGRICPSFCASFFLVPNDELG